MIIKRNMAIDSLTRVCEESLALIKQLIDADNETYGQGYEDGMAAQAKVQQTLKPWVDLTNAEIGEIYRAGWANNMDYAEAIQKALREKNT